MGGSAVKLADPSENDEYAPKHEEPFYMALVIECKDFPQAPGLNSMDKDKIDKPVTSMAPFFFACAPAVQAEAQKS